MNTTGGDDQQNQRPTAPLRRRGVWLSGLVLLVIVVAVLAFTLSDKTSPSTNRLTSCAALLVALVSCASIGMAQF
jgi:hypothetical protein